MKECTICLGRGHVAVDHRLPGVGCCEEQDFRDVGLGEEFAAEVSRERGGALYLLVREAAVTAGTGKSKEAACSATNAVSATGRGIRAMRAILPHPREWARGIHPLQFISVNTVTRNVRVWRP